MKKYIYAGLLFVIFFGALAVFAITAEKDAEGIRDGVLRFHVVANSDSETDQNNKLAVRDGLARLCSEIFGGSPDKESAIKSARQSCSEIESRAEQILKERGCDMSVDATVTRRFFPTRRYDGVSLPAGVYDTLDIRIGEAAGENFFCVMFPDICVGASSARENKQKMSDVLEDGSYKMATDSDSVTVKFRFKLVEIIETVKNFLFAQK